MIVRPRESHNPCPWLTRVYAHNECCFEELESPTEKTTWLSIKNNLNCRVFERRLGGRKFASTLLSAHLMTSLLEVLAVLALPRLGADWFQGGILPAGPYGLIFPLFVNYYQDIPRISQTRVLGLPITGKTITYILGLQLALASKASVISALCGCVSFFFNNSYFYLVSGP